MRSVNALPYPFVIGDVGSNWKTSNNQSDNLIMAKRHIYDGARVGLSAIKFQLFTDKELYGYEGPNQWSLPKEWLPELAAYANQQGIEFMCTAFSLEGYQFVDQFVSIHKVASCEMKHVEILGTLAKFRKPILISTGGAHHTEIGMVDSFMKAFEFERLHFKNYAFLECVATYPAKPEDYNLKTIQGQGCEGQYPYAGISDHTKENVVALVALALGAKVFEKHFTAVELPGISTPDLPVSLNPLEMTRYVRQLLDGYLSLGDGVKRTRPSEKDIVTRHRRRLKVIAPIKQGEILKMNENFGIYRSLTIDCEAGAPEMWQKFQGGTAKKDLKIGDPVWTTTVQPNG